jgi:hypothetical protein
MLSRLGRGNRFSDWFKVYCLHALKVLLRVIRYGRGAAFQCGPQYWVASRAAAVYGREQE